MEKIISMLTHKGTVIGFFSGLLIVLKAIREGTFKWSVAIPNLAGATIMGYLAWSIGEVKLTIHWNIAWTFFMSINAFFVLNVMTDPELIKAILNRYINKK